MDTVNFIKVQAMCRSQIFRAILLLLAVVGASPLWGDENTLLENSPFLPPGFGEEPTQQKNQPEQQGPLAKTIEFRSVVRLSDQWLFSLYNLKENRNIWVSLSEEGSMYQITEYNPDENRLKLAFGNQTEWLPLKEPSYSGNPQTNTSQQLRRAAGTPPQAQPTNPVKRPSLNRRRVPSRRQVTVPRRETDQN